MDLLIDIWNNTIGAISITETDDLVRQFDGIATNAEEIKKIAKTGSKELQTSQEGGFLGMPIYDNDILKLMFRFVINMFSVVMIVRYVYYPIAKRKDYLFTYIMISLITFFICFTLKKFDLGLGMALGLFAIFGIIRYRTDPIPIKEMTYLFIIIGMSVINSLANKKMSYAELAFTNVSIIIATYILERLWLVKHVVYKTIIYEKINLIKPDKYEELKLDLEDRTGLKINSIEVGKIDFLRDTANLKVYFFEDEQSSPQFEERVNE